MPTYDYVCDACGHSFEKFQRFSEQPVQECPQCHKLRVRRVIHPTGIIFKGSGWYVTDHGRSSHRVPAASGSSATKKAGPDGGSGSSGSSTGSTSTETASKPAVDTDD